MPQWRMKTVAKPAQSVCTSREMRTATEIERMERGVGAEGTSLRAMEGVWE